jgi:hypothetical protein
LIETGRRDEAQRYGERYIASAPPAFFAKDIARVKALLAR